MQMSHFRMSVPGLGHELAHAAGQRVTEWKLMNEFQSTASLVRMWGDQTLSRLGAYKAWDPQHEAAVPSIESREPFLQPQEGKAELGLILQLCLPLQPKKHTQ